MSIKYDLNSPRHDPTLSFHCFIKPSRPMSLGSIGNHPRMKRSLPEDEGFSKSLNQHRGYVISCDRDSPDRDKTEDIDIIAEDVVDFLRVSLSLLECRMGRGVGRMRGSSVTCSDRFGRRGATPPPTIFVRTRSPATSNHRLLPVLVCTSRSHPA